MRSKLVVVQTKDVFAVEPLPVCFDDDPSAPTWT